MAAISLEIAFFFNEKVDEMMKMEFLKGFAKIAPNCQL